MDDVYLWNSFKSPTLNFYRNQFFNMITKKWLSGVIFLIFISETLQKLFLFPDRTVQTPLASYSFTIIAFVCYGGFFFISLLSFKTQKWATITKYRHCFVIFSVFFFSVSRAIDICQETINQIELNSLEKWPYSLSRARSELWLILAFDNLVPMWYLKLIIPCCYWVAQIVACYYSDMKSPYLLLYNFVLSMIYLSSIWKIKAASDWDIFLNQSNSNAWNETLKSVINKMSNAIAIVDTKKKIIYSNNNFKVLCNNSVDILSQKLSSLKKVAVSADANCFTEQQILTPTIHKEISSSHEGRWNSHDDREDTEMFPNFNNLLEEVISSATKYNKQKSENCLIYSAQAKQALTLEQATQSYEIRIIPLKNSDKILFVISDQTLRDKARSLEMISQHKDKLLATVSHDMRAPINGGLTFIENAIQQEDLPERIKEKYLIPAQNSYKFLLHLTNDILDFAQMNAHKLRLIFENLSLIDTLKSCYQLVEMQAKLKRIDFQFVVDESLPEYFSTDHNRLSQVITNLLTNAIKFTSEGQVKLSAQVIDDSLIEIKVSDTGIGIKEEDLKKLFKEFTRLKYQQANINSRGVGLGLKIANKLAKSLGPSTKRTGINVSSVYGVGTVFSFLLQEKTAEDNINITPYKTKSFDHQKSLSPYMKTISSREENFLEHKMEEMDPLNLNTSPRFPYSTLYSFRRQASPTARLSLMMTDCSVGRDRTIKGKVLIVDDNPMNILALESLLKPYGIIVDSAFNGKEAISKVIDNSHIGQDVGFISTDTLPEGMSTSEQLNKYQVIFMDCEMPIMDGFETSNILVKMMEANKVRTIPIIGYTGYTNQERLEQCLNSGMVDVISKPPQRGKLINLMERYFGQESNKELLSKYSSL